MEQAKQSEEELDNVDKSSYPLDNVPSVSDCYVDNAELKLTNRSRSQEPRLTLKGNSTYHALNPIGIASRPVYLVRPCRNVVMVFSIGISQVAASPAGSGLYGT
jgi:hypothetical protein